MNPLAAAGSSFSRMRDSQPAFMPHCRSFQPRPQRLRTPRPRKQALQQRPQIQPCPSGNDRQSPPLRNLHDGRARIPLVVARAVLTLRRNDVDAVMRHLRPFFCARLRRADLEVAIHRDRIAAHNFAIEFFSQHQGQRRLAAGRRPQQHHQQRQFAHHRHQPRGNRSPECARTSATISTTSATISSPAICRFRSCRSRESSATNTSWLTQVLRHLNKPRHPERNRRWSDITTIVISTGAP